MRVCVRALYVFLSSIVCVRALALCVLVSARSWVSNCKCIYCVREFSYACGCSTKMCLAWFVGYGRV